MTRISADPKELVTLLEKAKLFSKKFFVIIDFPEELKVYFFTLFYSKDNIQEQNEKNLARFKFLLVIGYIHIIIYFSRDSDLKSKLEEIVKDCHRNPLKINIYKNIELDFRENYVALDEVLNKWDPNSIHAYHDLTDYINKYIRLGVTYKTAIGLWFLYNLNFKTNPPSRYDIMEISPLLGSCIITASYFTRSGDYLKDLDLNLLN